MSPNSRHHAHLVGTQEDLPVRVAVAIVELDLKGLPEQKPHSRLIHLSIVYGRRRRHEDERIE
jgi:hypothetical protein